MPPILRVCPTVTVYMDNPAGRLHAVLVGYQRSSSNAHPPHVAWFGALGMGPNDIPELLRRVALVLELPAQAEAEIAKVDPDEFDRDSTMRWQPQVTDMLSSAIFINLGAPSTPQTSQQAAQKVGADTMFSLEQCSFVLHRYRPQHVISETDVQRIRSLVDELIVTVNDELSDEPELREFLLHHALTMMRALSDLEIRGEAALEDAYDQAIGAIERKAGELAQHGYTRREAWKKFGKVILCVTTILQVPNTALQLPTEVRGVIEGPAPTPDEKVTINEKIVVQSPQERPAAAAKSSKPPDGLSSSLAR